MAELQEYLLENKFESSKIDCPACGCRLEVVAVIKVTPGTVRNNGSDGFRQENYSVSIKTEILRFEINHSCVPSYKKGATSS